MRKHLLDAIRAHAAAEYPREACGLIVQAGRRQVYVPCENTAADAAEEFRISADAYAAAEDRGEVIGVVHSHPDASSRPSVRDVAACNSGTVPWHILSWPEGDLRTIVPEEAPLIGRPWAHGTDHDCYGLIRAWYRQERGIELPRYPHDWHWWETGDDLYLKHYADAGFEAVRDGTLQVGDVILMQIQARQINHGAIYLGDDRILHHLYGRLSGVDVWGGYWRERARLVVRYTGPARSGTVPLP